MLTNIQSDSRSERISKAAAVKGECDVIMSLNEADVVTKCELVIHNQAVTTNEEI